MSKVKTSIVKSKSSSSNDFDIKVLSHNKMNDTYNNYLVLSMTGSKLNNIILNTLRRTIMELVPTYAFDKKDIDITKNTSIYNNDYMRLRLCQFPIIGVENDIKTIERSAELEYTANISTFEKKIEDINILEQKERDTKAEKSQNLIMYINVKNTTSDVLCLTTNDQGVKFYYKGKIIESPYKLPLLVVKLKPGEEFICTATSSLNIGLKETNHMPTAVCVFSEPSESEPIYKFNIESLKQLSEKEIISRACKIIDLKMINFKDVLISKITEYHSEKITDDYNLEKSSESKSSSESDSITDSAVRNSSDNVLEEHRVKGIIKIENESHTFGNLLSRYIQDHPSVIFGGYKIDHLLIKELTLGYKTDGTDIINILNDVISEIREIFSNINVKLDELTI
jgi:DNA-directed RNA polymerase subunit L